MFVFFRKKKVLYQVNMYMFRNGDLHVVVTCRMVISSRVSITLPCFNHIAVFQSHCRVSITLPCFNHIAVFQSHCRVSITLPCFKCGIARAN